MVSREVSVVNPLGLHARAAARFVKTAAQYRSRIQVERSGRATDGKSILGLLLLSAARGADLVIRADGPDEGAALDALCGLIQRGFEDA